MKAEAWIFGICTGFFVLVAPAYWFITGDPTGTSALVMTTLLTALVTFYLGFHASRMEPRPEDRKDGEIADGGGRRGRHLLVVIVVLPAATEQHAGNQQASRQCPRPGVLAFHGVAPAGARASAGPAEPGSGVARYGNTLR